MISVEDARERILSFFEPLDVEHPPILDALGQVLAEDAIGRFDIPPWDNSAMDGYAVRAVDIGSATPESATTLTVTGTVAAGELPTTAVSTGTTIRIMTGAPLPDGADAVVPFEDTDEAERDRTPSEIGIRIAVPAGGNVRRAGGDIRAGETAIERGTALGAAHIGVLASLGYSTVSVIRRPNVAILATGNELIEPSDEFEPGKIYNSNGYSVASAVRAAGGVPLQLGIARDTIESISEKLEEGIDTSDVLITTAGVSKGDYDLVKDVLAKHGTIELWSVRMRPAKPLAFGVLTSSAGRRVPLIGLPGNPVSSLVAFEQLGRPALRKMLGHTAHARPIAQAVLEDPIHNYDGRRVFARAIVTKRDGTYYAKLTGDQSSNLLTSMAKANGLAICPEDEPGKYSGDIVDVQMINWPESEL